MNILITAGGTVERIDSVRGITNFSTGALGSLIAAVFSDNANTEKIFYVCGKSAIKPQSDKTEIIEIESAADLEAALRKILNNTKIDAIIHSMAVSDYRVKRVESVSMPELSAQTGGKLSSDADDLVLYLERTPKIISLFSELSPNSTLVGFKLLDNVSLETLIDRGFEVLQQNGCTFVLANDLQSIRGGKHVGYLINKDMNYTKHESKQDIANAIVSAVMR